jgi:hypothetical protein
MFFSTDIPFKGSQSLSNMSDAIFEYSGVIDTPVHVTAVSLTPPNVQQNYIGETAVHNTEVSFTPLWMVQWCY